MLMVVQDTHGPLDFCLKVIKKPGAALDAGTRTAWLLPSASVILAAPDAPFLQGPVAPAAGDEDVVGVSVHENVVHRLDGRWDVYTGAVVEGVRGLRCRGDIDPVCRFPAA